jgi:hypothetical protein
MLNDLALYGKNLKSFEIVVFGDWSAEVVVGNLGNIQLSVAVTENFLEKCTSLEKFRVVFSEDSKVVLGEEVNVLLNKRKGFSVIVE